MSRKRIAVVGAGIGGLSAAGRLAAAGHAVDLYEAQSFAGGKAGSEMIGDYRFDTGPSLLTMPFVFDDWFKALGKRREDYVEFIPLSPITSYFFPDGTRLKSYSEREKLLDEIASATTEDPRNVARYLDHAARVYTIAAKVFLFHSLHEWSTYRSLDFIRSLPGLPLIGGASTMDRINRKFFTDPRLVQLFNRYATYNGSNPYRTPGTMSLIPHVEYNLGAYGVGGGIYALPQGMRKAAEEVGVRFHFNTAVDQILTQGRRINGIRIGGEKIAYDAVVSNADVLTTYDKLLQRPEERNAMRYRKLEPSSSGIVFYWGVKREFDELSLHNILFSSDYPAEFASIFEKGEVPEEPTVYINITSKLTREDAPSGGENWFILINAPAARGQDWERIVGETRERVERIISTHLKLPVGELIEAEGSLNPPEIEARTSSTYGSLYGIASNSISSSFSRHRNRSRRYPGLYFVGGSAHPGGGMPLALLSGSIAADLISKRS